MDSLICNGETWAVGDMCSYDGRNALGQFCIDQHNSWYPNHLLGRPAIPEPLILMAIERHEILTAAHVVWFMSVTFGLCWRLVWPDDADDVVLCQKQSETAP